VLSRCSTRSTRIRTCWRWPARCSCRTARSTRPGLLCQGRALDPQNAASEPRWRWSIWPKGDSEVAFRDLEQVAAADPGNRADLALIAAHLQRREFDQALKAIAGLEKKQPTIPLVHNLRGTALLGKRDPAGARQEFRAGAGAEPGLFPGGRQPGQSGSRGQEARRRQEAFRGGAGQGSEEHAGLPGARRAARRSRRYDRGGGGPDQPGGDATRPSRRRAWR
jgi:hypothetical protein